MQISTSDNLDHDWAKLNDFWHQLLLAWAIGRDALSPLTPSPWLRPVVHYFSSPCHPTCIYLITLSAWKSSVGGMVRPKACAVLMLMTSSNFIGCSTGRSAGWAPFR